MDKALYVGMTAAKHNMLAQAIRSNNLANANTNGFRGDFEQARSMSVYYGEGLPTRAFALTENPASNFATGPLNQTGRDLDVAIAGDGFIAVQNFNEQGVEGEAFTRAGNLSVDSAGMLRTGNGLPVLGDGGPITLPPFQKIEIAKDGTISLVLQGAPPSEVTQLDRIRLVNPEPQALEKRTDGLMHLKDDAAVAVADINVNLTHGFLEGSNVNPIEEISRVISLARQYEMSVKVMETAKQNSEASARLLQTNG
jgi:flagellar basal-body rod protein FlgF